VNKVKGRFKGKTSVYLSICIAAALSQTQWAAAQTTASSGASKEDGLEELVVTGYRKSLADSTNFKKESIGFADGIFAEDMGKFPDSNAAESFNRIPGITIGRDMFGSGTQVAIRGLGTSFVKVLMNGSPISVASSTDDGQNQNRQVDLDMMPTQFFTQLTVAKSPDASMIEGGASGVINMRQLRAFDNPGAHLSAAIQGTKMSAASKIGERGTVVASNTWGDFGVLVGLAGLQNQVNVSAYETIGWTNAGLSAAQCGTLTPCNATGSGNWTIPATVPAGAGNGLTTGATIDQAFLLAQNPSLTSVQQIDNALVPRLGRNVNVDGKQQRINAVASLEWKPSDELHFYVDTLFGRKHNNWNRIDLSWIGRSGSSIPLNTTVDRSDCSNGCAVTSGQYANAQVNLEFRPYTEDTKFLNINPGFEWKISELLRVDMQANKSHGTFHREVPSVLVDTVLGSGLTVNYVNNGDIPSFSATQNGQPFDLNNPANFGWNGSAGGRVNLQDEFREANAKGVRANLTFGNETLNLKSGFAYDDQDRLIRGADNSQNWQNAVCGDNPNVSLPGPNTQPPCQGLSTATPGAGYPTYPGLGTNYSAGYPALVWQGSLIPNSAVANYLKPGPAGFVTVDWKQFAAASNYYSFHANEPRNGGTNTGANGGFIGEKVTGFYTELNGDNLLDDKHLRWTVGARWVKTKQTIQGVVSLPDPRNAATVAPADGGKYPNIVNFAATTTNTYSNALPSVEIAYAASEHTQVKFAASKTMTRPDPSAMLPGVNFGDPSAQNASIGNSALTPYLSENLDFGFDIYTGQEGYIGIQAFRKRLTGFTSLGTVVRPFSYLAQYGITYDTLNPTQQGSLNLRGGPTVATVNVSQQFNSPGPVTINGVEFNFVQPLDIIGLPGFGVSGNYTVVDQFGTGAAPSFAANVPPHTFNMTAYYEKSGISVRISQVYTAGSIQGQNGNGVLDLKLPSTSQNAFVYNNSYRQWDFASSFDLAKIFRLSNAPEITFDVQNIFKAKQRSYFEFPNVANGMTNPGSFYMLGLRQKF